MLRREPAGNESWRIFRIMSEFVEGFETLGKIQRAVSIFGSARTPKTDPLYLAAEECAKRFVHEGYAVITGGGPGIMEAGNKGAIEAKGISVGLNIQLPHEQDPNPYQTIPIDFRYFYARKVMFLKYTNAVVCFPGGYGTADEFFETLTLIQTHKIDPLPMVLFGSDYWGDLVKWMKKHLEPNYISKGDTDIFRITDSVDETVKWVLEGIDKPWWGLPEAKWEQGTD
jgi:uncharacterized protein (TIGR00730 family)